MQEAKWEGRENSSLNEQGLLKNPNRVVILDVLLRVLVSPLHTRALKIFSIFHQRNQP